MSTARYLIGDVFDQLATIPDHSVDLVATSPPFWRQRAYLPADHPDKQKEIGQENSPGEFIDVLLRLTAEFRRVVTPHGSIAVELGDTMAGSGGAGGDYDADGTGFRPGQPKWKGSNTGNAGALAKSHCMIPEAYRFALAYGMNPHTGQPSPAGKWIVRNTVAWCRPNPTPGDDGDKYRRATSYICVATLNPRRWWDGEAVRVEASPNTHNRIANGAEPRYDLPSQQRDGNWNTLAANNEASGTRPLYDWWEIAPQGYPGAHYAVWTPEIARRLILSMCPDKVCRTCGEPSRRIVETERAITGENPTPYNVAKQTGGYFENCAVSPTTRETLGWTDCGHQDWRPGHILDPFGGSGTTAAVATGHGRDCTLIDVDDRNVDLAYGRIGMFLEVPA